MLSVIVPAYNSGSSTLRPCLEALRGGTYKDYELIVVDDASKDTTHAVAREFADKVIVHETNKGRSAARNSGIKGAKNECLVFVDSDVTVNADTLQTIADYFLEHPDVDAVSGMLSKEHPNTGFFSQYKNLYMNFVFSSLPRRIHFLYTSICAVRRSALPHFRTELGAGEDTDLGMRIERMGKTIHFLPELAVVHLKSYTFMSWVRNDFDVPYGWAHIFLRYEGWKQLGKDGGGFAHAKRSQLASVVIAPTAVALPIISHSDPAACVVSILLAGVWGLLSMRFLQYLHKERGLRFAALAAIATWLDHLVMAAGIVCGSLHASWEGTGRRERLKAKA